MPEMPGLAGDSDTELFSDDFTWVGGGSQKLEFPLGFLTSIFTTVPSSGSLGLNFRIHKMAHR